MTPTTRHNAPPLVLHDDDVNRLGCREVAGRDGPVLSLFVRQEGEEAGVHLTTGNARELRDYLNAFLWRHDDA
jgi:hypothetical protein